MYGRKEIKKIRIDPAKLATLSREELYLVFDADNFAMLDAGSRLAVLQEVENRRAKLDGRPALRVMPGDGQDFIDEPGYMGVCIHSEKCIRVNYRFLTEDSPVHTGFRALETVLHEGRHGYQHFMLAQNPSGLNGQAAMEWFSCHVKYFDPNEVVDPREKDKLEAMYMLQSIEMDARRFARAELSDALQTLAARGIACDGLVHQLSNNLIREIRMIDDVRQVLTLDDIDRYEKQVLDEMRKVMPNVDFTGFRPLDAARIILKWPKLDSIEDYLDLIGQMDKMETDKLKGVRDDKADALRVRSDEISAADAMNRVKDSL